MQPSRAYRRYVLGLLLTAYILSYVDRQILYILIEPIKQELDLSDTQIGLMGGFSFALFYATLGMPIAYLADRYSRKTIITMSMVAWSTMTVLSGTVVNFWQMLLVRMGVAVGEAGCNPCAHSLISDFYPPEKRATALSVYQLGISAGVMLGLLLGGWISQFFGWRMAFVAVGLPGLFFSAVLWFTLKEPRRGLSEPGKVKDFDAAAPTIKQTIRHLWSLKSFRHLALGSSMIGAGLYPVFMWSPSFLMRSYDLNSGEVGTVLAIITGIFGAIGTYFGGVLVDKFGHANVRWYLFFPGVCAILAFPFSLGVYLSGSLAMSLAFMGFPVMLALVNTGACYSLAQRLAQLRMRAITASILLFLQNMIGLGLGPQITGLLSDWLAPVYAQESLRYALLIGSVAYLWAGVHFLLGAKYLQADLVRVEGNINPATLDKTKVRQGHISS